MLRIFTLGLVLSGVLLAAGTARAHHFTIELEARAGKASKKAQADTAAVGVKPKARGVLRVLRGELITVKWVMKNADRKATFKDVFVHCFAVKEEKTGQTIVPKLNKDVAVETVNVMDFRPGDSTEGELTFTIETPGSYLLRLETIGAAAGDDLHEHFAALDLEVR